MLREQWRNATPAQRQQMIEHAREQRMTPRRGPQPRPPRAIHRAAAIGIRRALKCAAVGYRVPPLRGRTGMGTLQTSTRPAGTLNHSSWRLRRASR